MASRRGQKRGGRHPAAPELPVPLTLREDPFLVRGGRRKVLVSATLENRMENAYNTSLRLSFSRNLHLASFTPQVPGVWEGGGGWGVWGLCPESPRGSRVRLGVQSLGRESGRSAGSHPPPLCPQRDRPVKVECAAPAPHARLCGVGHPVFPTGAKAGRGPGWERGCVRARAGAAGPGVQGRGHQGSCSSVAAPEEESAMTPCPLPPR